MATFQYALCVLMLMSGLLCCKERTEKDILATSAVALNDGDSIELHPLKKLFVSGDFDGDGKRDTIFQHAYSKRMGAEIDSAADPFQTKWEVVLKWFLEQHTDVYLTGRGTQDTLHVEPAQGLYCLINIGDINTDGKDEIALVVDRLDFSLLNSCQIYSLCNNRWTLLKHFDVHESAFYYDADEAPDFVEIEGYLEKDRGQWVYKENEEMRPLTLEKCE